MAKKKKKAEKVPVDLMGSFTAAAEKALGPGAAFTPSGDKTRHVGLPLPSFSFEYLLGSNVLWLGASYGLAGPTQSFKSSLAMDIMRGVLRLSGQGVTVETEGGKISEKMIESLLGELRERHRLMPVESVEAAQDALTFVIKWIKKQYEKRDALMAVMLDSLFGASGEEMAKQIEKEGHGSRAFPVEALLWSQWLRVNSPKLNGWPIILLFVNHLKKSMDSGNYRHPGGDAQDFYSTVYMHVARVKSYEGADEAITQIQIRTVKHSYFLPGRKIYVPYVFDKVNNNLYFDWGHSTADLLVSELVPTPVKKVLPITSTGKSMTALSRRFSCKELGLKDVTGKVLGDAIHANEEIMSRLREAARINIYDVWDGIMPIVDEPQEQEEPAELDDGDVDDALDI